MMVESSKTQPDPYVKAVMAAGVVNEVYAMIEPNALGLVLVRSTAIDNVIG